MQGELAGTGCNWLMKMKCDPEGLNEGPFVHVNINWARKLCIILCNIMPRVLVVLFILGGMNKVFVCK